MEDKYQQQIDKLDNETLQIISTNREKALEYARRGIEQNEPEKLNDVYIEEVADNMQALAKRTLEEQVKIAS